MNKGESASSSDCYFRLPCSLNSSPIDPFQKHRELRTTQVNRSALGLRPDEAAALQSLGEQAKTIAVPPQKLYDIASAAAKNEHMAGEGMLLQYSLYLAAESIKAAAQVCYSGSNPDLRSSGKLNHLRRLSRIVRMRT